MLLFINNLADLDRDNLAVPFLETKEARVIFLGSAGDRVRET